MSVQVFKDYIQQMIGSGMEKTTGSPRLARLLTAAAAAMAGTRRCSLFAVDGPPRRYSIPVL
jgi:hypothetical protein